MEEVTKTHENQAAAAPCWAERLLGRRGSTSDPPYPPGSPAAPPRSSSRRSPRQGLGKAFPRPCRRGADALEAHALEPLLGSLKLQPLRGGADEGRQNGGPWCRWILSWGLWRSYHTLY